jgi:hypothetical protein
MNPKAILIALLALSELSFSTAQAELLAVASGAPVFSDADVTVIARNELLFTIVESDPWLVRRILDAIERASEGRNRANSASSEVDPVRNPGLARSNRSADSSVEWIELLKLARAEKEARRKAADAAQSGRSAEGSIELIEMMKRIKAAKDAGAVK